MSDLDKLTAYSDDLDSFEAVYNDLSDYDTETPDNN